MMVTLPVSKNRLASLSLVFPQLSSFIEHLFAGYLILSCTRNIKFWSCSVYIMDKQSRVFPQKKSGIGFVHLVH